MKITISDRQRAVSIDRPLVRRAARAAASGALDKATIEIVFVDDATIRDVNRRFLKRDCATDVIAFDYRGRGAAGEPAGEIVISAERAAIEARRRRIPVERELMLYVIHGVLHLAGHDDLVAEKRRAMRQAERAALKRMAVL